MSEIRVDAIKTRAGAVPTANDVGINVTGTVLQVVSTTVGTETSFTSSTYFATSTSVSITPTSSSSKILVTAVLPVQCATSGIIHYTLYRGSTNLGANDLGRFYDDNSRDNQATMTFLDSPSTTSATTYAVYLRASGGGTHYYNINNAKSTIVAQEIAG